MDLMSSIVHFLIRAITLTFKLCSLDKYEPKWWNDMKYLTEKEAVNRFEMAKYSNIIV